MAEVHFLLVYDLRQQRLIAQEQYEDPAKAAAAYARLEATHRGDKGLEIVLVGADSIETIMSTHGHYFRSSGELVSPYKPS